MNIRYLVGATLCAVLIGCGGSSANVKSGPKPSGATFYGVWQSPQYGNMHLCQEGSEVFGDYVKDERYGRIQGKATGDLLRFNWKDSRELVRGLPNELKGRGYFKLKIGDDGDEYLQGEWGVDDNEVGGGPWNAVKMRRSAPDRCQGARDGDSPQQKPLSWDDDEAEDSDGAE